MKPMSEKKIKIISMTIGLGIFLALKAAIGTDAAGAVVISVPVCILLAYYAQRIYKKFKSKPADHPPT